jgi:DNA polymerase-1
VFHNRKHDVLALRDLGIEVAHKRAYDTMLMSHFVDENIRNKGLEYLSKRYGGKPKARTDEMDVFIKAFGWDWIPVEIMAPYAIRDAEVTYELYEKLLPTFRGEGFDGPLWQRELRFSDLISRMEVMGVSVDRALCKSESAYGHERMEEIRNELGLNPASPKDLEFLLIDSLGLAVEERTPTGAPSFNKKAMALYEEQLEQRHDPTAALVLEYRGWQKTVSSNYDAYLDLVTPAGTLHPNFKLHGTRTGRLSCEKPNLQQLPRSSPKRWNGNLKRAFLARPGYRLYEADYSNLELRLCAVYSQEPNLLNPLAQGFKPFDVMAEQLGWPRQNCKTFTYATLYGGGDRRISNLFALDRHQAAAMRQEWFASYPLVQAASDRATRLARQRGYVSMWTGRRRHLRHPDDWHKAFNALLQGGAAELVKSVMLNLAQVIDWDSCRMLLQVHDSVVFEIAQGTEDRWLPIIREVMQDVGTLHAQFGRIPFPVEIKEWASE